MAFSTHLCIFLLLASALKLSSAQTPDYCDPELCFGYAGIHVACNATDQFASTCSPTARIVTVTNELRVLFIRTHNQYRNAVAEGLGHLQPAVRMASMQWDPELAHLAEIRSRMCNTQHDKCRSTAGNHFAGQNIARTAFTHTNLDNIDVTNAVKQHITMWYNGHERTTMDHINHYANVVPSVGAFTAIVQEKANKVGCAILQHINSENKAEMITTCNYAYINVVDRPVYTPGPAASQCVTGTNTAFTSLCKVAEEYDVNVVPGYDYGVTTKIVIN